MLAAVKARPCASAVCGAAGATRAEFVYEHRWRVGDLLLWDNRSTMHRRDPFDKASRRVMHRTQIKGKWPPRAYVTAA